ncbi:MAG TPA: bi-domain-containing oxidoreductase [Bryobacteraceae bacterium]|nr:bi-domain-containing oxidoreductase [Bryobacteraceae bacterium]
MKQVIRKGLKEIIVDEVPDPMVRPHHVLVRPLYSLISSGTETASIHQEGVLKEVAENPSHLRKILDVMKAAGPLPTLSEVRAKFSEFAVLGYSGAGVVAEKHATVTDVEIGDRVAYGGEGTGHGESILTGRNLVARVPESVPFQQACFTTLGCIAMNAVRTAQISIGDVVAVIGLGLVGQLIAQLARLQGAVVAAIDLKPERVDLARRLGAEYGLGGSALRESVNAITSGHGADCVIVAAASKSSAPAQQGLQICRDRGRMIIVGAVGMEFPWNEMYLKEVQLFMSRAYGPGSYDAAYEKQGRDYPISYVRWTENRNMQEFLRLLAAGQVAVEPLVTHEYPLDEAARAYQTILDPASGSLAVLLRYPAVESAQPAEVFEPRRRVETAATRRDSGNLRVALVGAGNLAKWHHLPNLKKIPNVTLRAVHSSSGARGKSYALRFGAEYCCSDYDEILKDPAVDVVLIASRNPQHASEALAALEAGKHVFVEKPMALTEDECRELCAAVERTGKQLTVGFNRRFAPYYLEQKKALARRTGPALVTCRINSPGISGSYWMADPASGGAILGEACHFVDLLYWLLDAEPLEVSAYSLPTGKQDPIGENNMVASFRFSDGSIGNLTYSTVGSKTSGGERVEVFAQGLGSFTEDFKRLEMRTAFRHRSSRMWPEKGYYEQMEDFLKGIREGRAPAITVYDGARSTLGCLAMLDSARSLEPRVMDMAKMRPGSAA